MDFTRAESWLLIHDSYLFTDFDPLRRELHIAPTSITINHSNSCLVQVIHQPSKPAWSQAGKAYQLLSGFEGQVRPSSPKRLFLEDMNYLDFDQGDSLQWQLAIQFVTWLKRVHLRVWTYIP